MSSERFVAFAILAGQVGNIGMAGPIFQYSGAQLLGVSPQDPLHPKFWLQGELTPGPGWLRTKPGEVVVADVVRPTHVGLMAPGGHSFSLYAQVMADNDAHVLKRYPAVPTGIAVGYLCDRNGELAYGFADQGGITTMYRWADGSWIRCPVDLDHVDIVGTGPGPDELFVTARVADGKPRPLQIMNAVTGALGGIVLQDDTYDFDGWLYRDPASHAVVGAVYHRGTNRAVWFDDGYKALQKTIDSFFKGRQAQIVGSDKRGGIFLVLVYSDRLPAEYYTVDIAHRQVGLIKRAAPWIDPARMRPMGLMHYATRDGRKLDAYLTLPAGSDKAHPAPMVVLPHGGPFVRDHWGFNGEVQFLASRGYAVLQPNYRASPGYQSRFPEEDQWHFLKMSDDVTDAVHAALRSGLIDAHRVAIMGGSFGGYLAISGVTREPSLYRCAVSIAGVFDWREMMRDAKYNQFDSSEYATLKRRLGDPKRDRATLEAMSPIHAVSQIRVPVFVAHGKDDFRVDVSQSRALVSALHRSNIPCEVMIVGEEGHGFRHLANEVEQYERIEAFLAKNMTP